MEALMTTNLVDATGEFKAWSLLGQVGVVSAALGLVAGLALGAAGGANAPEGNAASPETRYAVTHFDHSHIASTGEPETPAPTF
jgi:hypothetical protein